MTKQLTRFRIWNKVQTSRRVGGKEGKDVKEEEKPKWNERKEDAATVKRVLRIKRNGSPPPEGRPPSTTTTTTLTTTTMAAEQDEPVINIWLFPPSANSLTGRL